MDARRLDDAASATIAAVEQKASGVWIIVDHEPTPAREWLPYLAACAGGNPPVRVSRWLARLLAGPVAGTAGRTVTARGLLVLVDPKSLTMQEAPVAVDVIPAPGLVPRRLSLPAPLAHEGASS